MGIRLVLATLAGLLLAGSMTGQSCKLIEKSDDNFNRPPVIEGQTINVAEMNWLFEAVGPPSVVEVRYQWEWIDYPYSEHPWGAWVTAREVVECQQTGLTLQVPARTVRPRGWYKGKYTSFPWSRPPRFHQVEFKVVWERNCSQTLLLSPKTLEKFRDHDAVLKRSCGAPEQIRFVRKKKP